MNILYLLIHLTDFESIGLSIKIKCDFFQPWVTEPLVPTNFRIWDFRIWIWDFGLRLGLDKTPLISKYL